MTSANPLGLKLMIVGRRRPGTTLAEHRQHIRQVHKPGPIATVDGIDEFWLADEAAAATLLTQWQAWIDEALVRPGLALAAGTFFLIATEAVLHAGPDSHFSS